MKLFGEYLIEQKIISSEVLLKALIHQFKSIPSTAEIVFDQQLLPHQQILEVLTLQTKEKMEFKAACLKLGFWNGEIEAKITHLVQGAKTPLGHILYAEGHLTLQELTKIFDEFISVHSKERAAHPTHSDFSPIFPDLNPDLLTDYFYLFSTEERNKLLSLANSLEADSEEFCKHFHVLKGSARFAGLQISEKILTVTENLVEDQKSEPLTDWEKLKPLCQESVRLVWDLRETLNSAKSEKSIWDHPDARTKIERHLVEMSRRVKLVS